MRAMFSQHKPSNLEKLLDSLKFYTLRTKSDRTSVARNAAAALKYWQLLFEDIAIEQKDLEDLFKHSCIEIWANRHCGQTPKYSLSDLQNTIHTNLPTDSNLSQIFTLLVIATY